MKMQNPKKHSKDNISDRIFQLYYPALMTFIVFTIAGNLIQNVLKTCTLENILLLLLCVFIAIHLTGSYLRIDDWSKERYPVPELISDCIDILCAIYICSAIVRLSDADEYISYLHLSIPFLIVSINQFWWFVFMRKFDIPALFRTCILFLGMVLVTVIETVVRTNNSLIAIVVIIAILAGLMILDKSPRWFDIFTIRMRKIFSCVEKNRML